MATRFGRQPIRLILFERGISVKACAQSTGLDHGELGRAVYGKCRPTAKTLAVLPEFLGLPVEKLFDERIREYPHKPIRKRLAP